MEGPNPLVDRPDHVLRRHRGRRAGRRSAEYRHAGLRPGLPGGGGQRTDPVRPGSVPRHLRSPGQRRCLRVINAAQDISTILSGVDEATNDVDLQRLDDIVRQLQPIENRLRADLTECQVEAIQSGETPPGTDTDPTDAPTDLPTGAPSVPTPNK